MNSVIFFGSDIYSTRVLQLLLESKNYNPEAVITTRPKPVGRDGVIAPNPVEKYAVSQNIKVLYYPDNKEVLDNFIKQLPLTSKTVGLTASFPRLLPPLVIQKFAGRLYNIHPSLLPQYRNVAPVPYALAMGDTITGVSIFEIGNGIDNGQIVAQVDHPIDPVDTTPLLLNKLFHRGTDLFMRFLENPSDPELTSSIRVMKSVELIFTRKLTRDSGYIEWPVIQKLINNQSVQSDDTSNPLIQLRLTHHPDRTQNILADLIHALDGYEKVWTVAETSRGPLTLSFPSPNSVLIAGKPKPISWPDFNKYYIV